MKQLLYILLIATLTLFSVNNSFASHYAGAELTYVNIGGATYQVTLTLYRDCSGIAAPADVTINFACGNTPVFNFTSTLSPFGTPVEITNNCSQISTSCSGGSLYGVQKFVYQSLVTIPPCGNWTMYWKSGARNSVSTVIGTPGWYIPAELNNLAGVNNSPVFNNDMISIANLNQQAVFDCGGVDPDGDSLSYSFYNLYSDGPNPLEGITYNFPFDSVNFITSPMYITLNPITGEMNFTPAQVASSAYGIKVEEWRNINGVMTQVGATYRDHTLNVIPSNSFPPVLSGIDTTASHTYSANNINYSMTKCFDGSPITFSISGFDNDVYNPAITGSPELFDISWNSGINGATFTPYYNGTDSAYAEFYWLPSSADIGTNNSFTATVMDYACAYNLSTTYTFTVNIFNNPPDFNLGNDTTIANSASINLTMPSGFSNYLWSNGSSNNTLVIDNSFDWQNEIIGTVTEGGICSSTDTINVYIGNVGVNDFQKSNIKVFPNPIDDVINIKLSKLNAKAKLTLYDVNGKLVRSAEFSTKEYKLKGLSNLAAGNYFMKINIDGELIKYSIIKN